MIMVMVVFHRFFMARKLKYCLNSGEWCVGEAETTFMIFGDANRMLECKQWSDLMEGKTVDGKFSMI